MPAGSWRAVRDSDVMLDTLKGLKLPAGMGPKLRRKIQAQRATGSGDGRSTAAAGVVAMLREARGRVDGWPLESDSFDALGDGLERTYRRGRRDFRAARTTPSVEALHEWRKRVKELWYHHTVLRELWAPVMQAVGNEAHELADRLGDDHDLAMLADWVREHAEVEPEFFEAVELRRSELQAGRWRSAPACTPTSRAHTCAACEGCGRPRRHLSGRPRCRSAGVPRAPRAGPARGRRPRSRPPARTASHHRSRTAGAGR